MYPFPSKKLFRFSAQAQTEFKGLEEARSWKSIVQQVSLASRRQDHGVSAVGSSCGAAPRALTGAGHPQVGWDLNPRSLVTEQVYETGTSGRLIV